MSKITRQELNRTVENFNENFKVVITEAKRTGFKSVAILNLDNGEVTLFANGYSSKYIESEVKDTFVIHKTNRIIF